MECSEVRSILSAYIDDEVRGEESRLIEEHLSMCRGCTLELEGLRSVAGMFHDASEIDPPAFLLEKIESQTIGRKKHSLRVKISLPSIARHVGWATAVMAVIGVLMGGLSNHALKTTPLAQVAVQPAPAVKVEVRQAAPAVNHAIIVAKAVPKAIVHTAAVSRHSVQTRYHRRHGLPEGKAYDGSLAPQLAARSRAEAKPVIADASVQIDTEVGGMADVPPAAPEPESQRIGVRVADALTTVNTTAEAEALARLRSSIGNKNRQKKISVQPDSTSGDSCTVGIASMRF